MMQKLLLAALAAGTVMTVATPAMAREGCGPGWHRGYYGRCVPNRGPEAVVPVPGGALVIGNFYPGRGYWDGHRYWQHREHWRGHWRYR